MTAHRLFVLGGARSGKSRYAQARAEDTGLKRLFIATAQAFDTEMEERIARHREERAAGWDTIESPLELARTIHTHAAPNIVLLVDCLTLWTSNLMLAQQDIATATDTLIDSIASARGPIIMVSNEVGLGIVPENALARRFRDEAGIVNQRVAAAVDEVQFLVSGLPMCLKS